MIEKFSNFAVNTLSAPTTATATTCSVTDPFSFPATGSFRIKIDGCVGESFIRSDAVLTRSTDLSDAVLAYYGETKKV